MGHTVMLRRAVPMLLGSAGVPMLFAGIAGVEVGGAPAIIALPVALGGLGWAWHRFRDQRVELRWAGRLGPASVTAPTSVDNRATSTVVATARPPATRRRTVAALARFESRQWLSSSWFGAGVGFFLLLAWLFGWVWARHRDGVEGPWGDWFVLMPVMAHPMVGMTVVAAHHAVTRGRRDGVEELFASCPVDETTRSLAQLRAGWVPAASVALFVVVASSLFALRNARVYGPVDSRAVPHVLAAVVLALCGSALGVALARWAPWRIVPIAFVAALTPLIVALGSLARPHWSNTRQLSSWPQIPGHDLVFTAAPVWWHLLWLVALGGLMVWLALLHASRTRRLLAIGVVVALAVVGTGVAETRPVSDGTASRLASLVAEPQLHQTCRGTERIEVCVFEGYEGYRGLMLANVAPIAAATPGSVELITLRQVFDGDLDALGPEVAARLSGRDVPADGSLALGFTTRDEAIEVARLVTAARAVGLPTDARFGVGMVIAGEARGVVMLWLAARGLDPADAQDLASADESDAASALELGRAWPDPCYGERSPAVAWSAEDLAAARALLRLPADDVHRLLVDNWERFVDPATSTDELLVTAGLEPVGEPAPIRAAAVVCDW